MPTDVPGVRHAAAPGEGERRRHPLPQRAVLPGAAAGAGLPRRRPRAPSTSRRSATRRPSRCTRREDGRRAGAARRGRPVPPQPGPDRRGRPLPQQGRHADGQRPAAVRQPPGRAGTGRCGGCWSGCRSGTSGRPRRRRWPASSGRWTGSAPRRGRSWPPPTASGRPSPRRCASGSRSTGTPTWSPGGRPPASGWRTRAPTTGRARWPASRWWSPARWTTTAGTAPPRRCRPAAAR